VSDVGYYAQIVLRFNDQAPPRPDTPRSRQSHVLRQGELLRGTEEVADSSEDDTPFHHGRPKHRLLLASELGPPFCPPKQLSGLEGYADQKCTVFSPTSLVHNRWKMLCCAAGAPSTVGVPATVCWYRRKRLLRCWRRRKGARKVVNWWVRERKRRRVKGEDMVMGEEDWWCWL
jgi:hypothetical protein